MVDKVILGQRCYLICAIEDNQEKINQKYYIITLCDA